MCFLDRVLNYHRHSAVSAAVVSRGWCRNCFGTCHLCVPACLFRGFKQWYLSSEILFILGLLELYILSSEILFVLVCIRSRRVIDP